MTGALNCTACSRYLVGDEDQTHVYRVKAYDSAGVWVDSAGYACLVIMALFEDGSHEMRLLYSYNLRASEAEVRDATQWCELPGRNVGIVRQPDGTYISR